MIAREDWLEERRSGIGGSDAPVVAGMSPWKTPLALYQEKLGIAVPTAENWSMRWGTLMEPSIRQIYSDMTGREVLIPDGITRHAQHPWMLATVDGITRDGRLVEIKTSRSAEGWGEPGTAEIPTPYMLQVQHYLLVTKLELADVVFATYGNEPRIYEVPADHEMQRMLFEVEAEFWQRVQDRNPPDPITREDAMLRWGRSSVASKVVADGEARAAVGELKAIREAIKEFMLREDAERLILMAALGENDTLVDQDGTVLATWKASKPAMRFNLEAFKSVHPDLYQQFVAPGEPSRRFLLK